MRSRPEASWKRHAGGLVKLLGIIGVSMAAAGCPLRDLLRPRAISSPTPMPTDVPRALEISALPVYRLHPDPAYLDAPSRLVVLYVRLWVNEDTVASLSLNDFALTLPNGDQGRVFDDARAAELVRRTTFSEVGGDNHPAAGEPHPSGGIAPALQPQIRGLVLDSLLREAVLSPHEPVSGYLVADMQQPLASLAGASLAVTLHRTSDAAPLYAVYEFPPAPAPPPSPAVPSADAPRA